MPPPPIDRRQFLAASGAAALAAHLGSPSTQAAPAATPDLIRQENAKPGALDWQLTRVRVDGKNFRSPWIEGYCSRQSVRAGESVDIMVSANPARKFRLEIFRLGYYGGRGARKVQELGPLAARTQTTPTPGEKALHECRWTPTTTLPIPADWPSGVYIGRMTTIPEAADFWSQGLSTPPGHVLPWSHWSRPHGPDERVQRITRNLLERALRGSAKPVHPNPPR